MQPVQQHLVKLSQPHLNNSVAEPIVAAGDLVDALFSALRAKDIVDSEGRILNQAASIPPLSQKQLDLLKESLNTTIVSTWDGGLVSFTVNQFINFIETNDEKIPFKAEIIGGLVRYILTSDPEWFKELFKILGLNEANFPWETLIASLHKLPPDFDIRFQDDQKSWQLSLPGVIVKRFLAKLFANQKALKKFHIVDLPGCQYSIASFGDRLSVEAIFPKSIDRDHLFTRDDLAISCAGTVIRGSFQSVIDLVLHRIRIKKPETVNHMGIPLLLSYISRGYTACSRAQVYGMWETFVERQNPEDPIWNAYIGHHQNRSPFPLIFQAALFLRHETLEFTNPELMEALKSEMSSQDTLINIGAVCLLKKVPVEYLSQYFQALALINHPIIKRAKIKEHLEEPHFQIELNDGQTLLLPYDPLKTLQVLSTRQFWSHFSELEMTRRPGGPTEDKTFFEPRVSNYLTKMEGLEHCSAKQFAKIFRELLMGSGEYARTLLQSASNPVNLVRDWASQDQTGALTKDAILAFIADLFNKNGFAEIYEMLSDSKVAKILGSEETIKLLDRALNQTVDEELIEKLLTELFKRGGNHSKCYKEKLELICGRPLLQNLKRALEQWTLKRPGLERLEWIAFCRHNCIAIDEALWTGDVLALLPQGVDETVLVRLEIKNVETITSIICHLMEKKNYKSASAWIEKHEGSLDQEKLVLWTGVLLDSWEGGITFARTIHPKGFERKIFDRLQEHSKQDAGRFLAETPGVIEGVDILMYCKDLPQEIQLALLKKYNITNNKALVPILSEIFRQPRSNDVLVTAWNLLTGSEVYNTSVWLLALRGVSTRFPGLLVDFFSKHHLRFLALFNNSPSERNEAIRYLVTALAVTKEWPFDILILWNLLTTNDKLPIYKSIEFRLVQEIVKQKKYACWQDALNVLLVNIAAIQPSSDERIEDTLFRLKEAITLFLAFLSDLYAQEQLYLEKQTLLPTITLVIEVIFAKSRREFLSYQLMPDFNDAFSMIFSVDFFRRLSNLYPFEAFVNFFKTASGWIKTAEPFQYVDEELDQIFDQLTPSDIKALIEFLEAVGPRIKKAPRILQNALTGCLNSLRTDKEACELLSVLKKKTPYFSALKADFNPIFFLTLGKFLEIDFSQFSELVIWLMETNPQILAKKVCDKGALFNRYHFTAQNGLKMCMQFLASLTRLRPSKREGRLFLFNFVSMGLDAMKKNPAAKRLDLEQLEACCLTTHLEDEEEKMAVFSKSQDRFRDKDLVFIWAHKYVPFWNAQKFVEQFTKLINLTPQPDLSDLAEILSLSRSFSLKGDGNNKRLINLYKALVEQIPKDSLLTISQIISFLDHIMYGLSETVTVEGADVSSSVSKPTLRNMPETKGVVLLALSKMCDKVLDFHNLEPKIIRKFQKCQGNFLNQFLTLKTVTINDNLEYLNKCLDTKFTASLSKTQKTYLFSIYFQHLMFIEQSTSVEKERARLTACSEKFLAKMSACGMTEMFGFYSEEIKKKLTISSTPRHQ